MAKKKITIANGELLKIGVGADPLRDTYGKWQMTDGGLKYSADFDIRTLGSPIQTKIYRQKESIGGLPISKYRFKVEEASGERIEESDWTALAENLIQEGVEYKDFVATLYTAPTNEEILNADIDATAGTQGVHFIYNTIDRDYEDELATVSNHLVIPSVYELHKEGLENNGKLRKTFKEPLVRVLKRNERRAVELAKLENQIVPIENNQLLIDYEGSKSYFPMFADIGITTDDRSEFGSILDNTNTSVMLIRDISEPYTEENIEYSVSIINAKGEEDISIFTAPAKTIDLIRWWNYDSPAWYGARPLPENSSYVGRPTMSTKQADSTEITTAVNLEHFYNRVNELAQDKMRTYQDLIEGKEAYSEILLYKIDKHLGNPDILSAPVQTFHLCNYGNSGLLDAEKEFNPRKITFVDTQIKYGEQYTYVVTAYAAVIGCTYEYSNLVINEQASPRNAEFDVEMQPVVKLIEIPLYVTSGKVMDFPPLPPQVSFAPYKGKPKKLMMFFDTSTGDYDHEPFALNEQEQADYDQMAINQNRTDGLLTFKSDDGASAFQIYRISKPPVDYLDFEGALLTEVSTDSIEPRVNLPASTAPVVVQQPVNKKFYYMFRTVDYHGGLSNPTPVYEVELYGDSGVGYPIIREYEFGSVSPKTPTKSARKMIQIIPRITQAYLNEEASGLVENGVVRAARGMRPLTLGVEDDSLFGKRFKVRLTSKTTGKKVDINIDFKTKRVRAETE